MAITEGIGHERVHECGWCGEPIKEGEPWNPGVDGERLHIWCAAEAGDDADFDSHR